MFGVATYELKTNTYSIFHCNINSIVGFNSKCKPACVIVGDKFIYSITLLKTHFPEKYNLDSSQ